MLVPATIGLRGNIFGAFGNRISTSIHAGGFRFSVRRGTVLGQNVLRATVLTLGLSAPRRGGQGHRRRPGPQDSISLFDLALVSIVGGFLGSIPVMVPPSASPPAPVRYGWDLDNVTAPLVSTLGDVLTLPALFLATPAARLRGVPPAVGLVAMRVALAVLIVGGG